jgi:hypothetical protein
MNDFLAKLFQLSADISPVTCNLNSSEIIINKLKNKNSKRDSIPSADKFNINIL